MDYQNQPLQVFRSSEFGELGVLELGGKPYFPATACAKTLGYAEPQKAIRMHCKGVSKMDSPTGGGVQTINYIPEGDLYRLIVRSKLPSAERFERWVFDEVLPSIRQHGAYVPDLTAIITQTTQAVIRELLPLLIVPQAAEEPPKRVRLKKEPGIIAQLEAFVREEIDDMLASRNYTYMEISEYLRKYHGVRVSRSVVGKYGKEFYERQEKS